MSTIKHPWQNGPTELIEYALQRIHRETDFEKRLAFLLLDVGVETLFKTFLTLPAEVTHAHGSHSERKQASEGNFHELVRGIEKAASSRLTGLNLAHVQFYHDLRNKLYHQGNGITIPSDKAHGYAVIAVDLLNRLLDVDLSETLNEPKRRAELQTRIEAKKREIQKRKKQIEGMIDAIETLLRAAVEVIEPRLVLPSFTAQFNNIGAQYGVLRSKGKGQAYFGFRSHPKSRIEVVNAITDLVKKSVTNPELRSKLMQRTNIRLPFLDDEIVTEVFAEYLFRDSYPDIYSVYFGVLDRLTEGNDWKVELDFASVYPETVGPPSDYDEEELLDLRIADANDRVNDLTRIREEITSWVKRQGASEFLS